MEISGRVVSKQNRYVYLEGECILACVDIETIFNRKDPHLLCLTLTGDPEIFHLAHMRILEIAGSLSVSFRWARVNQFSDCSLCLPPARGLAQNEDNSM